MAFSISDDLRKWLSVAGGRLNACEYRVYCDVLFEYVSQNQMVSMITRQEICDRLGLERHTVGRYLQALRKKGWIQYAYGFQKKIVVQWCRTRLDEQPPLLIKPGVVLLDPNGRRYTVQYGGFSAFEKRYKLPDRFVDSLLRRSPEKRHGPNKGWQIHKTIEC